MGVVLGQFGESIRDVFGEGVATLYRPDADERGRQRLGAGNAFGLRDCSSLPSRVVVVVCPRLSAYVCGCVVVGESSESSLLRA